MKKFLFIVLAAVTLFACQKKDVDQQVEGTQEVTFSAIQVSPDGGLKNGEDWNWLCVDPLPVPAYAKVKIDGVYYQPAVFVLDGKYYTQAIKLPVGTYTVEEFGLYDANNVLFMATPMANAPFSEYTQPDITFTFNVTAFQKAEVPVQVLCFKPDVYQQFGFNWFYVEEIVVRQQCFFGDFCVKHPADYAGSSYASQSTGLKIDMPAIVEIVVNQKIQGNWVPVPGSPFTNNNVNAGWGVGAPVCIQYADNLTKLDEFQVILNILVKQGNNFVFKAFNTWYFNDAAMITDGQDGVVDFVLGSCNLSYTDLQLAPYQNLPTTASVTTSNGGVYPTYWDVRFNSYSPVGAYDLPAPVVTMDGWCGDLGEYLNNETFTGYIYGSLYDNNWPVGMPFTLGQMSQINWIMNNLGTWGININAINASQAQQIQNAFWNIINNAGYGGLAQTMSTAAASHSTFVPLPGGWAAVLVVKNNLPDDFQLIFVLVDP